MQQSSRILFAITLVLSLVLVGLLTYSWGNQASQEDLENLRAQVSLMRQQQDFESLNAAMDSIQAIIDEPGKELYWKKVRLNEYIKKIEGSGAYSVYSRLIRGYISAEEIALDEPEVKEKLAQVEKDHEKAEQERDDAQDEYDACCTR